MKSKTIVLIHGMFVNNTSWNKWKAYYEQMGYDVYAPANPGHDGNPAYLRTYIHPDLVSSGFIDVVENIISLIDTLPEKPLVIGHSMAGLAVQKLVESGKVAAGVSIDGAPPKNVFPPFSTTKIVWPALGFFSRSKYYLGSRKWYNKAFFNTLPEEERERAYDVTAVPESRKVGKETLTKKFAEVNFKTPHAPLLFIGGDRDNIFPPKLTKKIAGRYKDRSSTTDLKIFPGRSHFICGESGWQEVADFIIDWYNKI